MGSQEQYNMMQDLLSLSQQQQALQAAMARLQELTAINSTIAPRCWSMVCPNYPVEYSLPQIIQSSGSDIRTIDYLFPATQGSPNPVPKTWLINIFEPHQQPESDFKITVVLFTHCTTDKESKIDLEGHGRVRLHEENGKKEWLLAAECQVVEGTGTGIFQGCVGGRASVNSNWSEEIVVPEGPEEWARAGLRLRPANWSFLFEQSVVDAFHLALLEECF